MSQNQEIIEAKLCAYIDGDLDPEGRAEIEKHLEANPQHRRLLESLKATRDLVRWLPRETAPPELAETLNGQLERSVLLDYDGESLRPRIFPRVFAAAAIIVLTAGLAAAVYFALPKSHRSAQQIAVNTEQGKSAEGSIASRESPLAHRESERETGLSDRLAKAAPADLISDGARNAEAAKPAGEPELDRIAKDVAANSNTVVAAANGAAPAEATPPSINNAVMMLVRTDKPTAAQKEVTRFLTSNQIQWRPADSAQQALAFPAQVEDAANLSANSAVQQGKQTGEQRQDGNPAYAAKSDAPAPARAGRDVPAPALRNPATQAATESLMQQQNPPQSQATAQQPPYFANENANSRANGLYVARMSRGQARALRASLNQGAQQAEVKELNTVQNLVRGDRGGASGSASRGGLGGGDTRAFAPATTQPLAEQQPLAANVASGASSAAEWQDSLRRSRSFQGATTRPASDVIAVGDELRLVSAADQKKAAVDEPAQTVRVSADGTINLPNIGVVHCAGLTLEKANEALTQAAAANPLNRGVTGEGLKVERSVIAQVLSDEKGRLAGAATQPAVGAQPTSEPAQDEAVNVVIVVEPNSDTPANTSAEPTTQPAAAAPAQPATGQPQTGPAR